ncbi:hypothetical protein OA101_04520, partial [Alphaproteobacteria bacterium]|nr:hypothetical protein [Alphaproteobacteria bacterium]
MFRVTAKLGGYVLPAYIAVDLNSQNITSNSLLAQHLGGLHEVRHQYQFSEGEAFIKIHIETET